MATIEIFLSSLNFPVYLYRVKALSIPNTIHLFLYQSKDLIASRYEIVKLTAMM
jgi:hypothetical protein